MLDTFLIFIIIFIIYRLYKTIGRKEDFTKGFFNIDIKKLGKLVVNNKSITSRRSLYAILLQKNYKTLSSLLKIDPLFSPIDFLNGAKSAFKIIVEAFGRHQESTLRPLLTSLVYTNFLSAIYESKNIGDILVVSVVGFKNVKILSCEVKLDIVSVTLLFVSYQVTGLRTISTKVKERDSMFVDEIKDIWTFSRKIKSKDINWKLSAVKKK